MSDATASYFAATIDGGFDHQRDAYEQGYEDGAAAARASERERIRQLAIQVSAHYIVGGSFRDPDTGRHEFADLIGDAP